LPRRSFVGLALVLQILSGCGWKPLYARATPDPTSDGVTASMAAITIDAVDVEDTAGLVKSNSSAQYDSRAAQLLHNHLRDALNPYGPPISATYHLVTTLHFAFSGGISLGNGEASREILEMTAKYKVVDAAEKGVLNDTAHFDTSYDILREPFIDLQSRNDAIERGSVDLAQAIQTRVAVFLKG
jgi:hypothetical protein